VSVKKLLLENIVEFKGGGTPSTERSDFWGGNIPWVSPKDMKFEKISDAEDKITQAAIEGSTTNLIPPDSCLVVVRSGILVRTIPVGLTSRVVAINQDIKALCPKPILFPKYLYYFLKSVEPQLLKKVSRGATVHRISTDDLRNLEIAVPSLVVQKRVVAILDEAFAGIAKAKENAERNLKNARELFDNYVQRVFDSGADKWVSSTLGEVYDVRDGTHDSPKYQDNGFPLITSKNLKREGLDFDKINLISELDYNAINQRSAVHKGDVLLAMIGTIGNPVLVEEDPRFAIKNVALFKVGAQQCGRFLQFYLGSKFTRTKMLSDAKGTTQKFVGLGYLRSFPIYVPPLKEQEAIALKLGHVQSLANRLETKFRRQLYLIDELRISLLRAAFSGELAGATSAAA
jgi:type I restriction enzyme, S subunit